MKKHILKFGFLSVFYLFILSGISYGDQVSLEKLKFFLIDQMEPRLTYFKNNIFQFDKKEQVFIQRFISILEEYPKKTRPTREQLNRLYIEYFETLYDFTAVYPENYRKQLYLATELHTLYWELKGLEYNKIETTQKQIIDLAQSIVRKFPNQADAYYHLGFVLMYQGNYEESKIATKKCLKIQRGKENCKALLKLIVKSQRVR